MGMSTALLVAGWAVLLAVTAWWLMMRLDMTEGEPAPEAPRGDPWAAEVDAFRRRVHDWDRRGGLDA